MRGVHLLVAVKDGIKELLGRDIDYLNWNRIANVYDTTCNNVIWIYQEVQR